MAQLVRVSASDTNGKIRSLNPAGIKESFSIGNIFKISNSDLSLSIHRKKKDSLKLEKLISNAGFRISNIKVL